MIRKSSSKKSTAIKICGLTKTSQARSIAELKINAIGVIGVKNSPRFVPEEECMKIFNEVEKVSSSIEKVLVIANERLEEVKCINNRSTPPSVIQLHLFLIELLILPEKSLLFHKFLLLLTF